MNAQLWISGFRHLASLAPSDIRSQHASLLKPIKGGIRSLLHSAFFFFICISVCQSCQIAKVAGQTTGTSPHSMFSVRCWMFDVSFVHSNFILAKPKKISRSPLPHAELLFGGYFRLLI